MPEELQYVTIYTMMCGSSITYSRGIYIYCKAFPEQGKLNMQRGTSQQKMHSGGKSESIEICTIWQKDSGCCSK